AEKLVAKGKSGWSFFGGSEEKYEQAAECYRNAAQAYEMNGSFLDAAATYIKAAEIQEKNLSDGFEAPDNYVHASDAYRRALMEEVKRPINDNEKAEVKAKAINCRKKAIKLTESSSSSSKLRRLSRMYDAIGQITETDIAGPLVEARQNLLNSKTLTAADEERMKHLAKELQPTPNEADELQWLQSKTTFSDEEKAHLKWLESQILPALDEARIAYKEAANFLRLDAPLCLMRASLRNANALLNKYADISFNYYEDALNAYATILKVLQGDPKHRFNIPPYCLKWCVCRLAQCDAEATRRDIPKYQAIEMDTYRQPQMSLRDQEQKIEIESKKYTLLLNLNEAISNESRAAIDELLQVNSVDIWQRNVFTDIQNKWEVEFEFA
ncbi:hypothetical protein CI102_3683, partial [Trichoderma harzianum]